MQEDVMLNAEESEAERGLERSRGLDLISILTFLLLLDVLSAVVSLALLY
jgi:hypothetical protein